MASKHLSDDEIQAYLDRLFSDQEVTAPGDLKTDEASQKTLKKYMTLYEGLRRELPLQLSPDFSSTVMSEIARADVKHSRFEFWQMLFVIFGFAVGICVSFYLKVFDFFSLGKPGMKGIANLLKGFDHIIASLNIDIGLLGTGLFMLLVMSLLDHFLKQTHGKPFSIFR